MATKTQIYKEVLREYDALRTRKAAELRERKESLYARFPRLAEIEETLSMVGVSTAKLVLLHPEEREKAMTEAAGPAGRADGTSGEKLPFSLFAEAGIRM